MCILRFANCRLAANTPIEDRHTEGYCNATDGFLFGVFDGHGGTANAQAVSERLFNYIAVNLLDPSLLAGFCERMTRSKEELDLVKFLTHNTTYFSKVSRCIYIKGVSLSHSEDLSALHIYGEKMFEVVSETACTVEYSIIRIQVDSIYFLHS